MQKINISGQSRTPVPTSIDVICRQALCQRGHIIFSVGTGVLDGPLFIFSMFFKQLVYRDPECLCQFVKERYIGVALARFP